MVASGGACSAVIVFGIVVAFGGRRLVGVFISLLCDRQRRITGISCLLRGLCPFSACFASVLRENELDTLPFLDNAFLILLKAVKDKKNLLKTMVECGRIAFLVHMLLMDVEFSRIELKLD